MAQDPIAKVKECFAARHDRVSPELPAHKASIEITASNKGKIVHINHHKSSTNIDSMAHLQMIFPARNLHF